MTMKPSVIGISNQYIQRIHFTTGDAGPVVVCTCTRADDEMFARASVTGSAGLWEGSPDLPSNVGRSSERYCVRRGRKHSWPHSAIRRARPDHGSCRRTRERGRRADCSATPGVHRCGIVRKLPSKRGMRSPAIPDSFGARIMCSPWQSCTPGAAATPSFMACPCTLSR